MPYKNNFCRLNFKLVSGPLHFGVNLAYRDTDLRKHLFLNISIKHLKEIKCKFILNSVSILLVLLPVNKINKTPNTTFVLE